jgi:hypothetical protein
LRPAAARHPAFAYVLASGWVGLALGLLWWSAFKSQAWPDPGPPIFQLVGVATGATIALAALPAALAVRLIRARGWRRGRADAIAGAVVACGLSLAVFLFFEGAFAGFKTAVTPRAVAGVLGFWFAPNTLAGALAGWLYWRLAGSQRGAPR